MQTFNDINNNLLEFVPYTMWQIQSIRRDLCYIVTFNELSIGILKMSTNAKIILSVISFQITLLLNFIQRGIDCLK